MINMILLAILSPLAPQSQSLAQFQPCVWPNVCSTQEVQTAQVETCVWPNICADKETKTVQVETCVWPNKCAKQEPVVDVAITGPCPFPRVCKDSANS